MWVIDEALDRRFAIAGIARTLGQVASGSELPRNVETLGVVGHHRDLEGDAIRELGHTPIVHYSGERFDLAEDRKKQMHLRFPWLIGRSDQDVEKVKSKLLQVFRWFHSGGEAPSFLRVHPVPEALLAYHLLCLLQGDRDASIACRRLRDDAMSEADAIAFFLSVRLGNIGDADARRRFLNVPDLCLKARPHIDAWAVRPAHAS